MKSKPNDRKDKYPIYISEDSRLTLDGYLGEIAEHLLSGDSEFLFGAGMSIDSGAPTGSQLSDHLIRKFFTVLAEDMPDDEEIAALTRDFPLEAVAEAVEGKLSNGRDDLTRILRELYLDESLTPSEAYEEFAAISSWGGEPRISKVFTTNFDRLLVKSFAGRAVPVDEKGGLRLVREAVKSGKLPVLCLHGLLDTDYQITETDVYSDRFRTLSETFKAALHDASVFVFVGYSMYDPDFRGFYMRYRNELDLRGKAGSHTYIVAPARSKYHYVLGKKVWLARRARWIPLDARGFFARLRRILDETGRASMRAAIMSRRGLRDVNSFDDLVARTQSVLNLDPAEAVEFLYSARGKTGAVN